MVQDPTGSLVEHFSDLEDPRIDRTKRHGLIDILVIAICAIICGADSWVAVELFGKAKIGWLRTFLELPNGIPSHDTFGRVFARLDPEQFQQRFLDWVRAVEALTVGQVIAVDGKTLRRSHDRRQGQEAIQMVSAWATANSLVLGQRKVDQQSNEITAIPELLQVLELSGCLVTLDALGCQKEIAEVIVAQEADYVLALKENQGQLYEDVVLAFEDALAHGWQGIQHDQHKTVSKGHGRVEIRQCWTISGADYVEHLRGGPDWPNLQTIAMVVAERRVGDQRSLQARYYISSLGNNARQLLHATRTHWQVENALHWVLDIAFREDESRVRKDHAAQNFAILRHIALNLLKQDQTTKVGIKNKRLKAGWDETYLLHLLRG